MPQPNWLGHIFYLFQLISFQLLHTFRILHNFNWSEVEINRQMGMLLNKKFS